jgi:arginase
MERLAVVGVPSSAGAHAPGQERAPEAFRGAGIVELLTKHGFIVDDRGDLPKTRWTPDSAHPRAQHAELVADVARSVATAVGEARSANDAVLVLGGDCTIEVGVVAAFSDPDQRIGLIYLDAGPDLNVPSSVRSGFLDWMVSAHLLGLPEATEPLSHVGMRFPMLEPEQIVYVGAVPDELTSWEHRIVSERHLRMIWSDQVSLDPVRAAREALEELGDKVDRLLVHFDVDVIDFLNFPAADFPTINAGITLDNALTCIGQFIRHPKFAALTVCEFNPDHVDEEQQLVRQFVEALLTELPQPGRLG